MPAARAGVDRLIADSPLGAVARAGQDPFGLARRLRLREESAEAHDDGKERR